MALKLLGYASYASMVNTRRSSCPAVLIVTLCASTSPLWAQPPQIPTPLTVSKPIDPDHPELHFAFLINHIRLFAEIASRKQVNRGKGDEMEGIRARTLGMPVLDLNKIDIHAQSFDHDLKKVEESMNKEREDSEKGKRQPDAATIRILQGQRYLAIVATMYKIRTSLPPASWNNLRIFLNTQYRFSVRTVTAGVK